ncbi:hypothetical protein G6F56_002904 [Rhizopus delemar]|nr:hypothetical protein G6F56_002904 [Rhizopus delemar]
MINTKNEDIFWDLVDKDKWAGHLTKKYAHHHCLTTQRAESAYRALKVGMTRRFDLITAFEHINKYRTNLYGKFDLQEQKEHQKVDNLMINNRKLDFIRNKVSRASLIAEHSACLELSSGNLLEEELAVDEHNCYCYARVNHQHLCIHTVISLGDKPFSIEDIHKRWHIQEHSPVSLTEDFIPDRDSSWNKLMGMLELQFRNCGDNFEEITHLQRLVESAIEDSNRRIQNNSDFATEKYISLPKSDDVKKIGRPPKEYSTVAEKFVNQEINQKASLPVKKTIKNKDNEDVMIDVNVDEMERDKKHPYVRVDQVHLEFQAKENYDLINVVADGFCGYRCLAAVYYGDEKKFWKVKMK